jgi:hypothetical protein
VADQVEDFAYLWTTERDEWVVLRVDPSDLGLPYSRVRHHALLIDENDELATAVVQRMIAEGVARRYARSSYQSAAPVFANDARSTTGSC